MSNIAEGFDAGYDKEFIRFLGFAFRSASEVQSQLYTALDQSYIGTEEFDSIYGKALDTKKQIRAFIKYLSKNQKTGRIVREDGPEYVSKPYGAAEFFEFEVSDEFCVDD